MLYISLFSHTLDHDDLVDMLKNKSLDIENIIITLGGITEDILYSMFFEAPEENLVCALVFEEEELIYHVTLDTGFYNKHIGKFIREVQRKIINDIIIKFITELEEIDWESI